MLAAVNQPLLFLCVAVPVAILIASFVGREG